MSVFLRRDEKRAEVQPYGVVRAITASAKRLTKTQVNQMATGAALPFRKWQAEAWVGYNRIGEVHYGFSVVANTLSRIRIYAGAVTTSDEAPVPLDQDDGQNVNSIVARMANNLMREFVSADFGSLVRSFALNMSVPGECLLVDIGTAQGKASDWQIKSVDELKVETDKITLVPRSDLSSGGVAQQDRILAVKKNGDWDKDIPIGRIWREHPRYSDEPDSSMLSVADPIEELLLLQRLVRSITRSRLNAGMVFFPDGITTASGVQVSGGSTVNELGEVEVEDGQSDPGNTFLDEFVDSAVTPVEDEGAPSSIVPMVVTGAAELGAAIKHITFERTSDQWLADRAERALERILQGIDVPKEIVTGLANVKYSNAMAIDEDFWKSNIEPLALVFVDAITEVYLRPQLVKLGVRPEDADRVVVWYDPSDIVTRPNHASEATEGYGFGLLGGTAWRREHGFADSDAPSEEELALQLLIAKSTIPDDVTASLLQLVLPTLLGKEREKNIQNAAVPFPQDAANLLNPTDTSAAPQAAPTAPLSPAPDPSTDLSQNATETAA